jgi:hypothetical protein
MCSAARSGDTASRLLLFQKTSTSTPGTTGPTRMPLLESVISFHLYSIIKLRYLDMLFRENSTGQANQRVWTLSDPIDKLSYIQRTFP